MALVKPPAGDVEAIKARLEAHDQQRERFGYCDETAPQIWEADIRALIARVEELEAAIREHCEACALSIECGRCSLDSPAYCAIRPYRGGE